MGGDLHFFIRHGLTGAVVVAFFLAGQVLAGQAPRHAFAVAGEIVHDPAIILLFPVVGVAVQGCYVLFLQVTRRLFTDQARLLIGNWLVEALEEEYADSSLTPPPYLENLKKIVHDSSFVWLYCMDVPAHLLEWARRRRSYHYLGVDWGLGALIGIVLGLITVPYRQPNGRDSTIVIIVTLLWVVFAWYLAWLMKRDVDHMELAWAHGRRYPTFKRRLGFVLDGKLGSTAETVPGIPLPGFERLLLN
jgi:hypothetical protein